MSHSFIDRNSNYFTQNYENEEPQKKIDPIAQLKEINDTTVREWGPFNNSQVQMFAKEEDLSTETKAKEKEESIQAKNFSGEEHIQETPNKTSDPGLCDNIVLTGSVGRGGTNKKDEVIKIMNRLKFINFFTESDYINDLVKINALGESEKIDDFTIENTINAISDYEIKIQGLKSTGVISKSGTTIKCLNAHLKEYSDSDQKVIAENISDINLTNLVSSKEFNLQGPVGKVDSGNNSNDLNLIQNRLIEIGLLSFPKDKEETPAEIFKRYKSDYDEKSTSIKKAHIPLTIKAISTFQYNQGIELWKKSKREFKGESLSARNFTQDVVEKNDITHYVLENFEKYNLTVKDKANKDSKYTYTNFQKVNDSAARYGEGVADYGNFKINNLSIEELKEFGLDDTKASALQKISPNEGGFDAVNTWDRARLSFGIIQFAGNSGRGTLSKLLATIKRDYLSTFNERFAKYGINVEYQQSGSDAILNSWITVLDPVNNKTYYNKDAEDYIKNTPELVAVFIAAGHDSNVQKCQVNMFDSEYMTPSMSKVFEEAEIAFISVLKEDKTTIDKNLFGTAATEYQLNEEYKTLLEAGKINQGTIKFTGEKITSIFTGDTLLSIITDMAVIKGVRGMSIIMGKVSKYLAEQNNLITFDAVKNLNDEVKIKAIKTIWKEGITRINKILG